MNRHADNIRRWGIRLVLVCAVLILCAPVGLAATAPLLATVHVTASANAEIWSPPGLPRPRPGTTSLLDRLVDPLPIVVHDLPDAWSQRAVRDYDHTTLLHLQDMTMMFNDAWRGLVIPTRSARVVSALHDALLGKVVTLAAPSVDAAFDNVFATAALQALAKDPRNGDRLNNAAVALFWLSVGSYYGVPESLPDLQGPCPHDIFVDTRNNASFLLYEIPSYFGPNRAALLNLAFLTSVDPAQSIHDAMDPLTSDLKIRPKDYTARLLLASLQTRLPTEDYKSTVQHTPTSALFTDALAQAQSTLRPLLTTPTTVVLGQVGLGDADLTIARMVLPIAPYWAQNLTRQALNSYDAALSTTSDPGIYAGRAAALDLLHDWGDAVVAEHQSVALAPQSLELRLGLAALQQKAGQVAAMDTTTQAALQISLQKWNPIVPHVRLLAYSSLTESTHTNAYTVDGMTDWGYMGVSYGSDRDPARILALFDYYNNASDGGLYYSGRLVRVSRTRFKLVCPHIRVPVRAGGGYEIDLGVIPQTTDPTLDYRRHTLFGPDEAILTALSAAVLSHSVAGAQADIQRWSRRLHTDPLLTGDPQEDPTTVTTALAAVYLAAGRQLPAGTDATAALDVAQNTLRDAGHFDEAAKLCGRAATSKGAGFDQVVALQCQGEATYLAHHDKPAQSVLERAVALCSSDNSDNPPNCDMLVLEAGTAALAENDIRQARSLYSKLLTKDRLGDLDLDAHNYSRAIALYNQVLSADPADNNTPPLSMIDSQRVENNRGFALLQTASPTPQDPPDCQLHRALCLRAQRDFAAALAIDPDNWLYLFNAGWVARLLNEITAAQADLKAAVAINPVLYPAFNDLGVLAAQDGHLDAARSDFMAALAVHPQYDLAAWNLGVLDMQAGIRTILPGQAELARAGAENGTLRRSEDLAYRFDERTYRVIIDTRSGATGTMGHSYSLAATTLGSLSLLVVLGQVVHEYATGKVQDTVNDKGIDIVQRVGAYLRARVRRRRGGKRSLTRWWSAWEPWILTLPILLLICAWLAGQGTPDAAGATIALALFATLNAVITHEIGHRVMARWLRAQVVPLPWRPGIVLALLLLPLHRSTGPYMGHAVRGVPRDRAWWVYLGGPMANVTVAIATYGIYLAEPLPLLRLLAQAQLAAAGFALLPFSPLDGHILAHRKHIAAALSLAIVLLGLVFAVGLL